MRWQVPSAHRDWCCLQNARQTSRRCLQAVAKTGSIEGFAVAAWPPSVQARAQQAVGRKAHGFRRGVRSCYEWGRQSQRPHPGREGCPSQRPKGPPSRQACGGPSPPHPPRPQGLLALKNPCPHSNVSLGSSAFWRLIPFGFSATSRGSLPLAFFHKPLHFPCDAV